MNCIKANRIMRLYGALISLALGCYASAASAALVPVGREPEFEVNRGQHDRAVLYLLRMPGFDTALVQNGAMFRFPGGGQLSMRFVNTNQRVETIPAEITGHRANYFLGETANAIYTDVPHYRQVRYQAIYPGIDLVFYGDQGKLEYDLNLQTGADPEQIELAFDGASAITILEDGSADISTRTGTLHQYAPRVYQEVNGKRQRIPARFVRGSDNTLRFALSTYDHTRPLVIDPVLSYSSYLGGSSGDAGVAVAVDASGSAYVTGITTSTNFPVQNAYKSSKSGTTDIFVAKLTPDGNGLVYSTYLGGRQSDSFTSAIAVDSSGNAYIAGWTTSNTYPVTSGAFAAAISGGGGIVTKLNSAGNGLVYSTYLKGATPAALRVDSSGSAYVAGYSTGLLPTTVGAFQANKPTSDGIRTGFLTKLNASGSALIYSTYIGGEQNDEVKGLALDGSSNAVIAGSTTSPNFPLVQAFQTSLKGSSDGFLARLNASGSSLLHSSYLGGSSADSANAVAVDLAGAAYIAGDTYSTDFPFAGSKPYNSTSFNVAFITAVSPDGTAITWSDYFGGKACLTAGVGSCFPDNPNDVAKAIAVDPSGDNIFVAGFLRSIDVVGLTSALQSSIKGISDAFLVKYSRDPITQMRYREYATRLGGSDEDVANGLALDAKGNAYLVGTTSNATDFPTTAGAFRVASPGPSDAFVAKVSTTITPIALSGGCEESGAQGTLRARAKLALNDTSPVTFLIDDAAVATVQAVDGNASYTTPLAAGIHKITASRDSDGSLARPLYCMVRP